VNARSVPGKPG